MDYATEKAKRLLREALNPQGMHTNGPTYVRIEASLLTRLVRLAEQAEPMRDAVENLIKTRGRFHTEQAFDQLQKVFYGNPEN